MTERFKYTKYPLLLGESKKEYKLRVRSLWREKNRSKLRGEGTTRRMADREKRRLAAQAYYQQNKEKVIQNGYRRRKARMLSDPAFKLLQRLRGRLYQALKGTNKSIATRVLLGCSIESLKAHIEQQFAEGMGWHNHTIRGWHVDHIKPLSSFNLANPAELAEAMHYTNLQPLWAADNLRKGSKIAF